MRRPASERTQSVVPVVVTARGASPGEWRAGAAYGYTKARFGQNGRWIEAVRGRDASGHRCRA
jgi:hypothetical protein